LCLANKLLPILIIVKGHAFVAVSLQHSSGDWNAYDRTERILFEIDIVRDVNKIKSLIDEGRYIAVECTGFAQSKNLPTHLPEGINRNAKGLLSFESAIEAGQDQLDKESNRDFRYAIDVAVAQEDWKITPLNILIPGTIPNQWSIYPKVDYGIDAKKRKGVLFYQADIEMLENSNALQNTRAIKRLFNVIKLEFRLLFLSIPLDSYLIVSPSHYLESRFCRDLLKQHQSIIEAGFVKLLVDYPDLKLYSEVKRDRYAKARHIPRYKRAYYDGKSFGINDLSFKFVSKFQSVGKRTLNYWNNEVKLHALGLGFQSDKLSEFLKRALETEKSAILYENLEEHMNLVGITALEAKILMVRDIMNRNYLRAYFENGINVPTGSSIIWDGLTKNVPTSIYDLGIWKRLFESLSLIDNIMKCSAEQLLAIKLLPETILIIDDIRSLLERGELVDNIIVRLNKLKFDEMLKKTFN
jgi:hypothetical protein